MPFCVRNDRKKIRTKSIGDSIDTMMGREIVIPPTDVSLDRRIYPVCFTNTNAAMGLVYSDHRKTKVSQNSRADSIIVALI